MDTWTYELAASRNDKQNLCRSTTSPWLHFELCFQIMARRLILQSLKTLLLFLLLFSAFQKSILTATSAAASLPSNTDYAKARQIRIASATDAIPYYQDLLERHPDDKTVATRLAASPQAQQKLAEWPLRLCQTTTTSDKNLILQDVRHCLVRHHFDPTSIANRMGIVDERRRHAAAPLYLTPAAAGTTTSNMIQLKDALDVLVSLFLVGLVVPRDKLYEVLAPHEVDCLTKTFLTTCEYDNDLVYSLVSVMPVRSSGMLQNHPPVYLATDWHPRVLASSKVGDCDAVMYIGPDSLALVQHWLDNNDSISGCESILDVCTGSGIQAIVANVLQMRTNPTEEATTTICVDVNPRALRFTEFNAALNGVKVTCVECDLTKSVEPILQELARLDLRYIDQILANPPFLPVPPSLQHRHGLFSDGGSSGYTVLAAVVCLARQVLSKKNGYLAIVSEFFFSNQNKDALYELLCEWWPDDSDNDDDEDSVPMQALLLTNEFPIDAETYAKRRADSLQEFEIWMEHLQGQGIDTISPGLLYVKTAEPQSWRHAIVPKTECGSIWTPSNPDAVKFTQNEVKDCFGNE